MEKTNKIKTGEFAKVVNELYVPTIEVEWSGLSITLKKNLGFKDVLTFVNNVVHMCFEDETGEYLPEAKDFAIKSCVIDMYTNIELTENVLERYDLIYRSDIVDFILSNVDYLQFDEIRHAINVKLEHLAQANLESINKQMNEVYSAFDNLEKQMGTLFSSMSEEDMTKLLSAFTNGNFDEEKLVKAYMSSTKDNVVPMPQRTE